MAPLPPVSFPFFPPSPPPCRLLTAPTQSAAASRRGVVRVRLRFNITRACANHQTVGSCILNTFNPTRTETLHSNAPCAVSTHSLPCTCTIVMPYTPHPFAALLLQQGPPYPAPIALYPSITPRCLVIYTNMFDLKRCTLNSFVRSLAIHLLPFFPVPTRSTRR